MLVSGVMHDSISSKSLETRKSSSPQNQDGRAFVLCDSFSWSLLSRAVVHTMILMYQSNHRRSPGTQGSGAVFTATRSNRLGHHHRSRARSCSTTPAAASRSLPHYHHRRSRNLLFSKRLETCMRLALLIVVFHIFKRGEGRLRKDVVALCARVVDRSVGFDREDVGLAVLFEVEIQMISH
jgi:hypothetical protein